MGGDYRQVRGSKFELRSKWEVGSAEVRSVEVSKYRSAEVQKCRSCNIRRMAQSRRRFIVGAGSLLVFARTARAAEFTFSQYHNQVAESPLHQQLVALWDDVRRETRGRVDTRVYAQNNNIPGSDPQALRMVVAGDIQFFTLMGGVLDRVVPVTAVQDMPFAFRSAEHAQHTMDGPLGAYLRDEIEAHGLHAFPVGAFDNGMRQISI